VLHTSVVGDIVKGAFNAAKSGVLSAVYRAGNAIKMLRVNLAKGGGVKLTEKP
jgi:hypothetical protein